MATNAQIQANRKNAKKSTGPKTPHGKAAVAQNALKHGLTATRDVVITETREDFDLHREALIQDLDPKTPTGSILATRIVSLSWRLRRAVNIQDQAIDGIQDKIMNGESSYQRREEKDLDPALALGRIVYNDFKEYRAFERLLMYEKRIENSLYKTMKELKTLKNSRKTDRIDQNYPKPNRLAPGPAPGQTLLQESRISPPSANPDSSAESQTSSIENQESSIEHQESSIQNQESQTNHQSSIVNIEAKPKSEPVPIRREPLGNQSTATPEATTENTPPDRQSVHPPKHLAPGFTGGSHCPKGNIPNPTSTNFSHPSYAIRDTQHKTRIPQNKPNVKHPGITVTPLIKRTYNQKASCPEKQKQTQ